MYNLLIRFLARQLIGVTFKIGFSNIQFPRLNAFCHSMQQAHNSSFMSEVLSDIIPSIQLFACFVYLFQMQTVSSTRTSKNKKKKFIVVITSAKNCQRVQYRILDSRKSLKQLPNTCGAAVGCRIVIYCVISIRSHDIFFYSRPLLYNLKYSNIDFYLRPLLSMFHTTSSIQIL